MVEILLHQRWCTTSYGPNQKISEHPGPGEHLIMKFIQFSGRLVGSDMVEILLHQQWFYTSYGPNQKMSEHPGPGEHLIMKFIQFSS